MIHGDIDLTENLDFYRDKKEKEYKNTRDFNPPAVKISNNSFIRTNNVNLTTTTVSWSSADYNYFSTRDITYYLSNNLNGSTIDETFGVDNILWYDLDDYYPTTTSTMRMVYSGISNVSFSTKYKTYTFDIPVSSLRPIELSTCEKLFGRKREKVYSNSRFGHRPKKKYTNCKLFTEKSSTANGYWRNRIRDRLMGLSGYNITRTIHDIFGIKRDTYVDDYEYSPIPWLEDLAKRHISLFKDYMEELRGKERDNDSYLTNYGWLRMNH